jgi:predicted metal-dependent hydrolase
MLQSPMFTRKVPPPHHGHVVLGGVRVPYTLTRTPTRRRSIGFRVMPGQGVAFRAPLRATVKSCEEILHTRAKWILKHFTKPPPPAKLVFRHGTMVPYLNSTLTLAITPAAKPSATLRGTTLTLGVPKPSQANALAKAWFKKQAATHFAKRVPHWARHMNLNHGPIRISDAKTRWGSCSHRNTLRFNWRLMMTPPALIDYVIVHELAHVPHKNHGPHFWALVEAHMPDYKTRRKQLSALGLILP